MLEAASEPKCLVKLNSGEKSEQDHTIVEKNDDRVGSSIHFGYDMVSSWFQILGHRFGLSENIIAQRATQVLYRNDRLGSKTLADDRRYQINAYRHKSTHHSQGTYPKVEDLNFYRAYHSMMIVAGELQRDVQVPERENIDEWDSLSYWLTDHSLTRSDGRWLADRRDPTPLEYADLGDIGDDEWRWSVSLADFDKTLFMTNNTLTVAGNWTICNGNKEQWTRIGSALVSLQTADALLRTLQTCADNDRYLLPDAGDDDNIDEGIYQLTGWIENFDRNDHIDGLDPWAANIHFPPLRPAAHICQQMGLCSDTEQRTWDYLDSKHDTAVDAHALSSIIWGESAENDNYEKSQNAGRRLLATKPFLQALLAKNAACLIIEVKIRRTLSSRPYGRDEEDIYVRYPASYNRYYLLKSNGTITTL